MVAGTGVAASPSSIARRAASSPAAAHQAEDATVRHFSRRGKGTRARPDEEGTLPWHAGPPVSLGRFSDASRAPRLSPPLPPLRKGGKVGGVWSSPPLAKGGVGGVLRVPLRCARFVIHAIESPGRPVYRHKKAWQVSGEQAAAGQGITGSLPRR